MAGVVGVAALLTALALSLVVTRIATVALAHTGLSWEAARFQSRSAFTGTGFTTREAESVVDHPVRRRIVMMLMVVRSAGLVTVLVSLVLSFAGGQAEGHRLERLGWLLVGVGVLYLLSVSRPVDLALRRAISWALDRWTSLEVRDYTSLLRLSGDYTVMELQIEEGDWLAGKELAECQLPEEGVTVLGIYRASGRYVGVPQASTEVRADDTLILYGRGSALQDLDTREAGLSGEAAHERAVDEQQREVAEQERQEAEEEREEAEEGRDREDSSDGQGSRHSRG